MAGERADGTPGLCQDLQIITDGSSLLQLYQVCISAQVAHPPPFIAFKNILFRSHGKQKCQGF